MLKQLYVVTFTAVSCWSGSQFLKHHKYWTIAMTYLTLLLPRVRVMLQLSKVSGDRFYVSELLAAAVGPCWELAWELRAGPIQYLPVSVGSQVLAAPRSVGITFVLAAC